jgi:hypothetical protein
LEGWPEGWDEDDGSEVTLGDVEGIDEGWLDGTSLG